MPITVTPQGNITLVRTALESDYKNTFTFSSLANQTSYFDSLSSKVVLGNDYTYMKKDSKIRVGTPIDNIINYNYCFYTNTGFTTKRYYCFITRMEYVNENCTDIYIQTDAFQTWYFQIVWNRCFVEREHVNNDAVGANTYPENLETGEYVNNGATIYNTNMQDYVYLMQVSVWGGGSDAPQATNIGGIPQAGGFYVTNSMTVLANILALFPQEGRSQAIQNVYMVPRFTTGVTLPITENQWGGINAPQFLTDSVDMPTTLNGYTPRNKKLLCFPYQYLTLFNNNGTANNLRFELFSNTNHQATFSIAGIPSVGGSIVCRPTNYNGHAYNHEEEIYAGKFPSLSWSQDTYTNWLTQNAVNIGASLASDATSLALGGGMLAAGMPIGGTGSVASGVTGITGTVGTIYQHSLVPTTLHGNLNGGDVLTGDQSNTFYYNRKSIKAEIAAKLDDYFDMFGYKVCRVKVPNITGRTQWNFIKTIDCNADGDIPQEDLETIRKACNTGITFWHTPANIYNYSLTNSIVS